MEDGEKKTGIDRISHLAEHLLHRIHNKLDHAESARTSILSKPWHSAWSSFLITDFSDIPFDDENRTDDDFFPFVLQRLRTVCTEQKRSLKRFRLSVRIPHRNTTAHVDDCINLVAAHHVKDLHLNVPMYFFQSVKVLAPSIFAPSIQVLKLCGVRLSEPHQCPVDPLKFPSLKQIHLSHIDLTENLLQNLVNGSPLLEQLSIINCGRFARILVCGLKKLKFLEIASNYHQTFHIDRLESLETFEHTGNDDVRRDAKITGCTKLKVLVLKNLRITEQWLTLLANFPALESLVISECFFDGRLQISNRLQHLELSSSVPVNYRTLLVDSSNLRSLIFRGIGMPNWLHSFKAPTDLHIAKIVSIVYTSLRSHDFSKLRRTLSRFHQSKILKLQIDFHGDQIDFNLEDIRRRKQKFPRGISEHVVLSLVDLTGSVDCNDLADGLIWAIRTRTLSIRIRGISDWTWRIELIEALCRKLTRITKGLCCSSSSSSKCWWHFIESVEVEWDGGSQRCDCESLLELLPKHPLYDHHFIRFRFRFTYNCSFDY